MRLHREPHADWHTAIWPAAGTDRRPRSESPPPESSARRRRTRVAPVCGVRSPVGPTERTSIATAPSFAARDGPSRSIRRRVCAVVGERHVEEHDLALDLGRATVELVEALDDDDVGFDAGGGRADRVAESEHRRAACGPAARARGSRGRAPTSAPSPVLCARSRGRPSSSSATAQSIACSSVSDPDNRWPNVSVSSASRCHAKSLDCDSAMSLLRDGLVLIEPGG